MRNMPATTAAASHADGRAILLHVIDATGGRKLWSDLQTMDFELTARLIREDGESAA
jgi:hypothetical protein